MRVIIIGAGVVGTMAAWRLAQAGHDVVVLEQFNLDHDRGSSYGDSRVVRRVYTDRLYTALMADAYTLWHELQSRFPDRELFSTPGGLFFGPQGHPEMLAAERSLAASGVAYESLDAAKCADRFPALKLHGDEYGLYEPSMGYARASQCVRAAARLARQHGAVIHESTPVVAISATPQGGVQVTTANGPAFEADRLVLCAGPWSGRLLAEQGIALPLRIVRKTYIHLLPERNKTDFETGRFPVWIDAQSWAYGFPRLGDVPGVKIAIHAGGQETSPGAVDRIVSDEDRDALVGYARRRFPDLSDEVVYEKVCLYTMTPDEDFIIDRMPGLPGAFMIGGTSGHGFKFGPLLGEIARILVDGAPTPYDLSRFSLARLL